MVVDTRHLSTQQVDRQAICASVYYLTSGGSQSVEDSGGIEDQTLIWTSMTSTASSSALTWNAPVSYDVCETPFAQVITTGGGATPKRLWPFRCVA